MEHLTAGFADLFFNHPEITNGADPKVLALWTWHAAEEAEHRATCFDIFKQLKGGYFTRVFTALSAWMFVTITTLVNTVVLLRNDRKLFTLDTLKGIGYLFGFRGLLTNLAPAFLAYLSPRFHPWKGRDGKDIAVWVAQSARYIQNPPPAEAAPAMAQPISASSM
jgi:predicted metal-dependent hydrolase